MVNCIYVLFFGSIYFSCFFREHSKRENQKFLCSKSEQIFSEDMILTKSTSEVFPLNSHKKNFFGVFSELFFHLKILFFFKKFLLQPASHLSSLFRCSQEIFLIQTKPLNHRLQKTSPVKVISYQIKF